MQRLGVEKTKGGLSEYGKRNKWYGASVLARLKNNQKRYRPNFQTCLQLLRRRNSFTDWSVPVCKNFILKGGMFLHTLTNYEEDTKSIPAFFIKKRIILLQWSMMKKFYIQVQMIFRVKVLWKEITPLLQIKDAIPRFLIARTRHRDYQCEVLIIVDVANWLRESKITVSQNKKYLKYGKLLFRFSNFCNLHSDFFPSTGQGYILTTFQTILTLVNSRIQPEHICGIGHRSGTIEPCRDDCLDVEVN